MVRQAISPNFYIDPDLGQGVFRDVIETKVYSLDNFETKLALYKDRVEGWFLNIAEDLKQVGEGGFIILMICLAHLEGIAQYRRGEKTRLGETTQKLKDELKRVFTIPSFHQRAIDILVEDARHGLFHDCMTRKRIFLSGNYLNPINWDETRDIVLINPHTFFDAIKADFERYVFTLADPVNEDERKNFEKIWDSYEEENLKEN